MKMMFAVNLVCKKVVDNLLILFVSNFHGIGQMVCELWLFEVGH
jgi:hypothetical protein